MTRHRWIHEDQTEIIAGLEARYAGRRLRFDTAFVGHLPQQSYGRIGNEYFYFRLRYDTASLTVGRPEHPSVEAGRRKRRDQRTRRHLRHGTADWFEAAQFGQRNLSGLERHPARARLAAYQHEVTGEEYCGRLDPVAAAELFTVLLDRLEPARPRYAGRSFRQLTRGQYTPPQHHRQGIITKTSRKGRRR